MVMYLISGWRSRLSTQIETIRTRGGFNYVFKFLVDWFFVQGYIWDLVMVLVWVIIANTVSGRSHEHAWRVP